MSKCFDCGKRTTGFRCRKCYEKAVKGELKYRDTSSWQRKRHFGDKGHQRVKYKPRPEAVKI